ncbi:EAL domain-containing protein [Thalassotalea euphylliae]|uniref:EAL domain-containing protein n=1 Tax=Thalassotalea euphylliae TaxID=1655234 RepID=A0A3E0TM55_9GAMM|nr:EAL domain-containing protein [Thalassotalea euphylliae]REL25473.1 EAL domain-containing protein [Thalassotalea euphylliae]
MFNSLRTSITGTAVLAIFIVSTCVLYFSILAYKSLYADSAIKHLDALSENLASDLIPNLVDESDLFAVSSQLLRLEQYTEIKFAGVYDKEYQLLQPYFGDANKASSAGSDEPSFSLERAQQLLNFPFGTGKLGDNVYAIKQIGDKRLPLGYLIVVSDLSGPLKQSQNQLLLSIFPFALIISILVIVVLLIIQNSLLEPLLALRRFAQEVKASGDYSQSARISGKSEVSDLTVSINELMGTISDELKKNRRQTKLLEQQQMQMEHLANFDALTGLPNRQFIIETIKIELKKAKRENRNPSLLFFDLDGFKAVNDTFGHDIGDKLLIAVANDVKHYIREGDTLSRLGGDEFLVLLHGDPEPVIVSAIAQRIIAGLDKTFDIEQWKVSISASIGIAYASDANYQPLDWVSCADLAMYRSKSEGKSQFTHFNADMVSANLKRINVANAIVPALKNNEFQLHYQKKVDVNQQVMGFEALIRWQSEELGAISPAEFVPIAEQSGKIQAITQWVVQQACRDLPQLLRNYGQDIRVAINLSAIDLKDSKLSDDISRMFRIYRINPKNIEFEITESAYLTHFDTANSFFKQMRELGCKIALDDFGTGYSSLGYLTQIKIDTLKIDKKFVDEVGIYKRSSVITKTIIEMAKQLGLTLCAEGVETQQQADFLRDNGCHYMQGYLFGKPERLASLGAASKADKLEGTITDQ